MAKLLCIETTGEICSVCYAEDGKSIALRETDTPRAHSRTITIFIDEVLREANLPARQLDAVVLSAGPGSYTGLRIGSSAAKGLCYALDKPLIAISTLYAMAAGMVQEVKRQDSLKDEPLLTPMIDARRMEVFTAVYDLSMKTLLEPQPLVLSGSTFKNFQNGKTLIVFGSGAPKAKKILTIPDVIYYPGFRLSSTLLIKPGEKFYKEGKFEDIRYFEPQYSKEFHSG